MELGACGDAKPASIAGVRRDQRLMKDDVVGKRGLVTMDLGFGGAKSIHQRQPSTKQGGRQGTLPVKSFSPSF